MRESQTPLQKLQNRYLWRGSVLAGLCALVLARSWVRTQPGLGMSCGDNTLSTLKLEAVRHEISC